MRRALAFFLLAASPALAETPHALQPTRDVDVTYRVPVPGTPGTALLQRLRFSATRHEQRVDLPTSGNWMVVDFARHRMEMVRDDTQEVVDLPAPLNADLPGGGAGYARQGASQVAGLPCTQWHTVDTRGQETLACYTEDGVLLRAASGTRILMEALTVHYTEQPGWIFDPPTAYSRQTAHR